MNETNINSCTIYRDEFNLIDTLPNKDKSLLAVAIWDYVFKNEIPNLNGHNMAIFNTLKHQLDKSKNKSKNAKKSETKENQNEIKTKSNENQIEIKQGSKTSVFNFIFYISNFIFNNFNNLNNEDKEKIKLKLIEWCKYKKEKNQSYKETGLNTLLKQVEKKIDVFGLAKVLDLVDESMANGYQGIIWERLNQNSKNVMEPPSWFKKEIKKEEIKLTDEQKREYEAIKNGSYKP